MKISASRRGGLILFLAVALPLSADVVVLKNGARFEGQVTETSDRVQIRMDSGNMSFPKERVSIVERKTSALDLFTEKRAALDAGDIEGHYGLACWAKREGLTAAAKEEFETVVALDPNHAGAREALGFRFVDGQWLTDAEWHAARGEVRGDGGWVKPQEKAAREESLELEALRDEVRLLREQLTALAEQSQAALAVAQAENRRLQIENLNLSASSSAFAGLVIQLQNHLVTRGGCSPFLLQPPIDIADPRLQVTISRLAGAPSTSCPRGAEACSTMQH